MHAGSRLPNAEDRSGVGQAFQPVILCSSLIDNPD